MKAVAPQPAEGGFVEVVGLDAVDRKLHFGIGVLHAERGPARADLPQGMHMVQGEPARIDLDTELAIGRENKVFSNEPAEPA